MGDDIAGACGQLVRQQERFFASRRRAGEEGDASGKGEGGRAGSFSPGDMEDLYVAANSARTARATAAAAPPAPTRIASPTPAPLSPPPLSSFSAPSRPAGGCDGEGCDGEGCDGEVPPVAAAATDGATLSIRRVALAAATAAAALAALWAAAPPLGADGEG